MTRLELQQKLMMFPPDAHVEICVRYGPDWAADFEVADVTEVISSNKAESWATISMGEMICEHALHRTTPEPATSGLVRATRAYTQA